MDKVELLKDWFRVHNRGIEPERLDLLCCMVQGIWVGLYDISFFQNTIVARDGTIRPEPVGGADDEEARWFARRPLPSPAESRNPFTYEELFVVEVVVDNHFKEMSTTELRREVLDAFGVGDGREAVFNSEVIFDSHSQGGLMRELFEKYPIVTRLKELYTENAENAGPSGR